MHLLILSFGGFLLMLITSINQYRTIGNKRLVRGGLRLCSFSS
jgi:hypothetical protein